MPSSKSLIRIATRKSALAMWQAFYVKNLLEKNFPKTTIELVPMSTQGDRILDTPLAKIGGKGLFIKELEIAMQEGRADLAVHSMKDIPVAFPEGFGLHCICERENPFDALVSNTYKTFDELPHGAVIGTSSLRRQAQLRALRPDLTIKDLRGNVNTRLQKLDNGEYDAIILAAAGLIRLDMHSRIAQELSPNICLPAVGQGAVGIECRNDDSELISMLKSLNHSETSLRVHSERALNATLQGGCQVPIGSFAEYFEGSLQMRALVSSVDGSDVLQVNNKIACELHDTEAAQRLGKALAEKLLAQGARAILDAI